MYRPKRSIIDTRHIQGRPHCITLGGYIGFEIGVGTIMTFIRSLILAILLLPAAAFGQLTGDDQRFMDLSGQVNLRNIALGNLAAFRGEIPAIREMGANLAANHLAAQQRLERIAAARGYSLPTDPSGGDKKTIAYFASIGSDRFGWEFLNQRISDGEKDLGDYRNGLAVVDDPAFAAYLSSELPVLQEGYLEAVEVRRAVE